MARICARRSAPAPRGAAEKARLQWRRAWLCLPVGHKSCESLRSALPQLGPRAPLIPESALLGIRHPRPNCCISWRPGIGGAVMAYRYTYSSRYDNPQEKTIKFTAAGRMIVWPPIRNFYLGSELHLQLLIKTVCH